jgi:hypothetical protein
MSRALTFGEFKALVRQLVKAVGGVEAAAAELGVSHQRISQLQSVNHDDQMTFLQVQALEAVAGRAIVTGAAARAIEGEGFNCVNAAAVEVVATSAAALRLVHDMDADGARDTAEIRAVQTAAQKVADAASKFADTAASLSPTRRQSEG